MTWVVNSHSFAKKVKNPSFTFSSNGGKGPVVQCSECGHLIHQNNEAQDWPGLPAGVKFDPSDKELLEHLAAKAGVTHLHPHPFINEFIPTLEGEDGICYTHPENLPGIRHDGSSMHYFHIPAPAYTTGTRKRRKIQSGFDVGSRAETRWHKTGKTRAIVENGRHLGCKKILVLYLSTEKGIKAEKTNWVMHQYHLGAQEEEREGELVVSKVFYQTQPRHIGGGQKVDNCLEQVDMQIDDGATQDLPQASNLEITISSGSRGAPTTPAIEAPSRPRKSIFETVLEEVERTLAEKGLSKSWMSQSPLEAHVDSISSKMDKVQKQVPVNSLIDHSVKPEHQQDAGKSSDWVALTKRACSDQSFSHKGDSVCKHSSDNPASYDLHNTVANFILTLDDIQGTEVSNRAVPGLENILLDTPPEIFLDSLISSQDTLDWLGKKKFGDSQETLEWLGKKKFGDSQPGSSIDEMNAAESTLGSQAGS